LTAYWLNRYDWRVQEGTKPQTLDDGLNDSPVGLAAWIIEKFQSLTDCHGNIENSLGKDDLLANLMIYWVAQTINSSFWLYYWIRHFPSRSICQRFVFSCQTRGSQQKYSGEVSRGVKWPFMVTSSI
jgi:hypothetical protein